MQDAHPRMGRTLDCAMGDVPPAALEPMIRGLIEEAQRLQAALNQSSRPNPLGPTGLAPISAREIDQIIRRRAWRSKLCGENLFCDPAWDLLLALYSAHLWQRREAIGAVTITAGLRPTTALRWLAQLEKLKLVCLRPDRFDGRRKFAELTEEGVKAMDSFFSEPALAKLAA